MTNQSEYGYYSVGYYATDNMKRGDTISIYLDMDKAELSFSVNGFDHGVAYNNVKKERTLNIDLLV